MAQRGDRSAQVLRNKRIVQRTRSQASASTLTPDISTRDHYFVTALAGALTIDAPIGNPQDGDRLVIRIRDDGTNRALTWNAVFRGAMPANTTATKTAFTEFRFNEAETKWDCVIVQSL